MLRLKCTILPLGLLCRLCACLCTVVSFAPRMQVPPSSVFAAIEQDVDIAADSFLTGGAAGGC